jgi:tetratricopeptide (TPR) repeat protein
MISDNMGIWIGIISSVITISLSVLNYNLNEKMQQSEINIKRIETDLKIKNLELESLKEKTARYEFVNKLMGDLLKQDKNQIALTTNLISLALNEEEAAKLFRGFANSEQKNIKEVGNIGIEAIKDKRSKYDTALEYEDLGFKAIIDGDYKKAIECFKSAENTYASFHQVYEIARLLKKEQVNMVDESARKGVLNRIVSEYSLEVPGKYIGKLKEMAK